MHTTSCGMFPKLLEFPQSNEEEEEDTARPLVLAPKCWCTAGWKKVTRTKMSTSGRVLRVQMYKKLELKQEVTIYDMQKSGKHFFKDITLTSKACKTG